MDRRRRVRETAHFRGRRERFTQCNAAPARMARRMLIPTLARQ